MKVVKFFFILFAKINQLIQYTKRVDNCFITYGGRCDGAGAQIHSILSILLFAKKFNLEYLHTPVKEVEHHKGDVNDWSNKWEAFFSLGVKEKFLNSSYKNKRYKSVKFPGFINKARNTIYEVNNCHSYTDAIANEYNLLIPDLKRKYYLTSKEDYFGNRDKLTIAVHIRRGDVKSITEKYNRYTTNEELDEKLSLVSSILEEKKIAFQTTIFSQGEPSDFQVLHKFKPKFFLNEDEFKTFHSLVSSDILIMAKSSYSYLAALLSEGIVFYDPFWHKPLNQWIDSSLGSLEIQTVFWEELDKYINKKIIAKNFNVISNSSFT